MNEAITKVIPIILLIVLGKFIKHRGWIKSETESQLKLGVINIALPVILFLTFKNLDLKPEYFLLSVMVFLMLIIFYYLGILCNKFFKINMMTFPFFVTGFAFGLLGIPLFEGVYGIESLGEFSILGIGNEFFIWFVYITLVKQKLNGEKFSKQTIFNFLKLPMIIAIFLGLLFNVLSFESYIGDFVLYQGIIRTFEYISTMTTPIILIVIGAGMNLEIKYVRKAFYYVFLRLLIILGVGYLVKFAIIDRLYTMNAMFDLAYFTLLILPTPFTLAIFVGEYSDEENTNVINNAIVISTIVCIVLFIGMVLATNQ
jgi:predicted permease